MLDRRFALVRFAILASVATFSARAGGAVAPPVQSQLLETHADTLTTFRAGRTATQDVRPRHEQRAVGLDGGAREAATIALSVAANPFERSLAGQAVLNEIRLDTGTWSPTIVDLSLPAPGFRWNVGRSMNARQDDSGAFDSDGPQGANWFQTSQPEIVLYDHSSDNTKDVLVLVLGADRYAEYVRAGTTSNQYKGKNGAAGCFDYQSGSPDLWVLTDQHGTQVTFLGFNTASARADGQLWKIEDTAGNKAYVGDPSSASSAVTSGYDTGGRLIKAVDTASRRYSYSYTADAMPRLAEVKAETKSGGSWEGTPTGLAEVGRVEYAYYGSESHGDPGDLKTVKTTLPLSDSGVNDVRVQYFRYWEGTYNSSTNPGYPHQVKLFLDHEGTRRFDFLDASFDQDFLTETTDNLKPYGAAYFEYDSSRRVAKTWTSGQCGCSGAATGTHEYRYETNSSYSDGSGYDTTWARRTSVKRPDNSWITQYFDELGQTLNHLITDADPANTSPAPATWATKVTRDGSGRVTEVSTPANVTAYTHSTGSLTASTSTGLVNVYTRSTSGDMTGFVTAEKYKTGTSGSAYFVSSATWTSFSESIGDVTVVRPLIAASRSFATASTTETGYDEIGYAYTSYSGASPSQPLALETGTTTYPAVSTTKNGSGETTVVRDHYRKDGLVDFHSETDGSDRIVTFTGFANGLVTTSTPDANTSSLSPPSTNFEHAGTPLNRSTTGTYDEQGRSVTTTLPDGRVTKAYWTVLADRRLVRLEYPKFDSGTGTHYGPVGYTVLNHAGNPEMTGVIAFSGGSTTTAQTGHIDESDSDPITAVDTGTLSSMRTSIYDSSGSLLNEERLYFAIPSSGAGTDGTHFDPTKCGYDDLGRRRRVKEAHGTITRTVYDARGQTSARWVGTNDSSFAGGEAGTDNMVKVVEFVYDGGSAGGNGLLTSRTAFVEDSTSDQRVTSYTHDVRGNLVLQTNPLAPHVFSKYDNLGRLVASGTFSSTANIVVGTDDPTTETSNRVGLGQSFFDDRGREWKSQRHNIDPTDGSDDDSLESLTWFDRLGRLAKVDGEDRLAKWSYDREGRETHEFVLAGDNDTSYAEVLSKSDDQVLEESQQVYDDGGDVVLSAWISRFHSDISTGSTSGPLDTNADADRLMLSSADIKGRIQITSSWYDALGRLQDRVQYGTNGGSSFDRDGLSVPARSDTALRTTHVHNDSGTLKEVADPKDLKTRYEYDALGRRTKVITNYVDGTPGGGTNGDEDQTVAYAFTDGLQVSMTADLPSGETDQVTIYSFGTTKGTSAGDSKISSGHLLQKVTYPDSANSDDVVKHAYNAQGQEIWKKDQAGNIQELSYDTRGRPTQRRVTTLDADFDGAVRRVSTSYNSRGQRELVTQYDNATVGSGSVVDEVKFGYDGWGNVTSFRQDRNSAVDASGSVDDYEVLYTWEEETAGRNTLRKLSQELSPGGRTYEFKYRSAGGRFDEDASRVTQITNGGTAVVTYDYNGSSTVVGTYLDEPDMMWRQYGSTAGDYADLDRFNRVTTCKWTKDLATDRDLFRVEVGWDRNSNVTYQDDFVHSGFDVNYTNDNLDRLVRAEEGTRSGGSITSRTRDQQWTLTQTGNWERDKVDLNGDGDFVDTDEHNADRTHNAVNELNARDIDDDGTDDFSLVYDKLGELTDDGEDYEYEWDALGRLRRIKTRGQFQLLVAEFKYNGLGYRIAAHEDTDDSGGVTSADKWFYTAYDERWRAVGTYRESDTAPKERYLNHNAGPSGRGGSSYIDLVVLRERDANTDWDDASDGVLEERLYYLQNWRADVVGLVKADGTQLEQVRYSAYGVPFGLPGGDCDSDGDCDATDVTQEQTWIDASAYDVRGDVDQDGDVDSTDKQDMEDHRLGTTAGRGVLSAVQTSNRRGYAGYEALARSNSSLYSARRRVFMPYLGVWMSRDKSTVVIPINLYQHSNGCPTTRVDPFGLHTIQDCLDLFDMLLNKIIDQKARMNAACNSLPPLDAIACNNYVNSYYAALLAGWGSKLNDCISNADDNPNGETVPAPEDDPAPAPAGLPPPILNDVECDSVIPIYESSSECSSSSAETAATYVLAFCLAAAIGYGWGAVCLCYYVCAF